MSGRAGTLDFIDDLALEIGATFDGQIALTDDNDEPIDLTGFDLLWQVRAKPASDVVLLSITEYCEVVIPEGGSVPNTIVFAVPPSVTRLLSPREAVTDLLLTQGDYGRFELRGRFQIEPTVSRA